MANQFMTAQEVADELGIHVQQARRLILAQIPHLRVGNQEYRVARSDFEEFVQRATIAPLYPQKGQ